MITAEEILMGRDKLNPITIDQAYNLFDLLVKINKIRHEYGKPLIVTSGYRPPSINKNVKGATRSTHLHLMGIDLRDRDGKFAKWCIKNIALLKKVGLYMEHPAWTVTVKGKKRVGGWVHLDIKPRNTTIFIPNSKPPIDKALYEAIKIS